MALDPHYVLGPPLEYYFVDKTTGLPLAGGIVTFFSDVNRTTPKAVYQLTGDPFSGYSYSPLPNPLILSGVGTFNYLGNDIVPYFYPYDVDGNVERYYITVTASDLTPQFTREAWPNVFAQSSTPETLDIENFIPNGQFAIHNNIPANETLGTDLNQITDPITDIAPGGWTFERPNSSTALDFVSFFRFGSYVSVPTASPRFAVQVQCNGPDATDTFKDLRIKFQDVNKFASDTNEYTISFTAKSTGANLPVNLFLINNFGTGGSPSTTVITLLTTFTLTNAYPTPPTSFAFTFPPLPLGLAGDNNDDFIQLAFGFPTDQTFTAIMTDFVLTPGSVAVDQFPPTTDGDFLSRSLVPPIPDPDGFNLALPIILTKSGYGYDSTIVGKVFPTISSIAGFGELLADGAQYETTAYSDDGIPYQRLYNVGGFSDPNTGLGIFGTGLNFANSYNYTSTVDYTHQLNITNKAGSQTVIADGSVTTGFVFSTPATGQADIGFKAFVFNSDASGNYIYVITKLIGDPFAASGPGTTPFTVTISDDQSGSSSRPGTTDTNQIAVIDVVSLPTAGQYFHISNTTVQYFVWYKVDGSGTLPVTSGTPIEVNITSNMTVHDVAVVTASALNAAQVSAYTVNKSGSTITPNSYFTFHANSQLYVVWYSLNGSGTQPVVAGAIYITVPYTTGDSTSILAQKTLKAVNSKYYAVADLRGMFIRGWDNGAGIDPNTAFRYSSNAVNYGDKVGTLEIDSIVSHLHQIATFSNAGSTTNVARNTNSSNEIDLPTFNTGAAETRPINMALNYIIKY